MMPNEDNELLVRLFLAMPEDTRIKELARLQRQRPRKYANVRAELAKFADLVTKPEPDSPEVANEDKGEPEDPNMLWPKQGVSPFEGFSYDGTYKRQPKPKRTVAEWLCHQAMRRLVQGGHVTFKPAKPWRPGYRPHGPNGAKRQCKPVNEEAAARKAAWARARQLWFNLLFRKPWNRVV